MTLVALTETRAIAQAYAKFCQHFDADCDVLERTISIQGGSEPATVRWFPALNFWVRLSPRNQATGYFCGFGTEDPNQAENLTFTCEINPPITGIDKHRAGLFVRSDNGTIYLAHSGSIAGGRPGVGRTRFLKFYGNDTIDEVYWPDKTVTEYIIIGALDDPELKEHVAAFVYKIAEFKQLSAK